MSIFNRNTNRLTRIAALGASAALVLGSLFGCASEDADFLTEPGAGEPGSTATQPYLYVASGTCYGGGATVPAGSGTVTRFRLSDGAAAGVIFDYASFPGDQPVGISDYDDKHLLVLVENTAGRRIDLLAKDGSGPSTFIPPSAALSAVLRDLKRLPDGSLLVSKSSAIEKFSPAKIRILQGANPFINAPAGACATSTTLISSVFPLSSGKVLFTHAAATPNNKTVVISANGYAAAGDCLSTQAAPATTSLPTAAIEHSSGKILVAYGSATAANNLIYSYTLNQTTNAWSAPTVAFSNISLLNGPSAMTEDPTTGHILVANGSTAFGNIVTYELNPTTSTLSMVSAGIPNVYTRCVSAMQVVVE